MKVLLDSNVAIDMLLENQPFWASSVKVIGLSKLSIGLFLSASAITDIYYIVSRAMKSKQIAMSLIKKLLINVGIASVTDKEIRLAVNLDWDDFEDAVQYTAGESLAVDYIVTRNKADFASAALPIVSPDELLALLISPDES